ncbi:MAG TPA: hypothetical protein VF995_03385, partial [Actinomycetota bacterium]
MSAAAAANPDGPAFEPAPWAAGTPGEREPERLIFERSAPGRRASSFPDGADLPDIDVDLAAVLPAGAR